MPSGRFSPSILLTMTTGLATHRSHPSDGSNPRYHRFFFHIVLKLRHNMSLPSGPALQIVGTTEVGCSKQQEQRRLGVERAMALFFFYPVTVVLHEIAEYTQDLSRSFCFLLISVLYTIILLRIRIRAVIVVAKVPR